MERKPSAIFSISSLGLGHATRTLAVIRSYEASHDIHVVSWGSALGLLKSELLGATFHELVDYPPLERGRGIAFYFHIVVDSLVTIARIWREHRFIRDMARELRPDFIISDGRYGSYARGVPSFLISHQISFVMPRGLGVFQGLADFFNRKAFGKFEGVIIPDYESEADSLAGELSHHRMLDGLRHEYVGVLSSYSRSSVPKDIDTLFVISGYLLEHRAAFVDWLIGEAKRMPGRKVFVGSNGHPDADGLFSRHGIDMRGTVSGQERAELFARAARVVSRSGYTTVMDLAELGIPGFLVPTPGQTEQEHLARHLIERGFIQESIASDPRMPSPPWLTATSVAKVRAFVSGSLID
ncbi:MAG: glycosyltransferase [Candidatus Paceibacterota bacterium]|jgi:hypothetical protein